MFGVTVSQKISLMANGSLGMALLKESGTLTKFLKPQVHGVLKMAHKMGLGPRILTTQQLSMTPLLKKKIQMSQPVVNLREKFVKLLYNLIVLKASCA